MVPKYLVLNYMVENIINRFICWHHLHLFFWKPMKIILFISFDLVSVQFVEVLQSGKSNTFNVEIRKYFLSMSLV